MSWLWEVVRMKAYIYNINETTDSEHFGLIKITLTISKKIEPKSKKIHIGECELIQDELRDDMHEPN